MEIKDEQRERLLDILQESFDYGEIVYIDMLESIAGIIRTIDDDIKNLSNKIKTLINAKKYLNKIWDEREK